MSRQYGIKVCAECGNTFDPAGNRQEYCLPKCRYRARYLRLSESQRERIRFLERRRYDQIRHTTDYQERKHKRAVKEWTAIRTDPVKIEGQRIRQRSELAEERVAQMFFSTLAAAALVAEGGSPAAFGVYDMKGTE